MAVLGRRAKRGWEASEEKQDKGRSSDHPRAAIPECERETGSAGAVSSYEQCQASQQAAESLL